MDALSRCDQAAAFAATLRASGPYRRVGVYDVTPEDVLLLAFAGDEPPAYPRFPSHAGLTGATVAGAAPVVANDVASDPRCLTAFASTGSELIFPILDGRGRVVGTIDVESAERDAFGAEDVARIGSLASELQDIFSGFAVRVARAEDAASFVAIYAPFVERTHVSFEEDAPDEATMRAHIAHTLLTLPWLAATIGQEVAGYAYASPHRDRAAYRWSVDVSAYVAERFRGRSVGRRLYDELFAILERLGYRRAFAGIALPNEASLALHRAARFEPVGVYRRVGWKLGAWHDVMWLARDIGAAVDEPPRELVPFTCRSSEDSTCRPSPAR